MDRKKLQHPSTGVRSVRRSTCAAMRAPSLSFSAATRSPISQTLRRNELSSHRPCLGCIFSDRTTVSASSAARSRTDKLRLCVELVSILRQPVYRGCAPLARRNSSSAEASPSEPVAPNRIPARGAARARRPRPPRLRPVPSAAPRAVTIDLRDAPNAVLSAAGPPRCHFLLKHSGRRAGRDGALEPLSPHPTTLLSLRAGQ